MYCYSFSHSFAKKTVKKTCDVTYRSLKFLSSSSQTDVFQKRSPSLSVGLTQTVRSFELESYQTAIRDWTQITITKPILRLGIPTEARVYKTLCMHVALTLGKTSLKSWVSRFVNKLTFILMSRGPGVAPRSCSWCRVFIVEPSWLILLDCCLREHAL